MGRPRSEAAKAKGFAYQQEITAALAKATKPLETELEKLKRELEETASKLTKERSLRKQATQAAAEALAVAKAENTKLARASVAAVAGREREKQKRIEQDRFADITHAFIELVCEKIKRGAVPEMAIVACKMTKRRWNQIQNEARMSTPDLRCTALVDAVLHAQAEVVNEMASDLKKLGQDLTGTDAEGRDILLRRGDPKALALGLTAQAPKIYGPKAETPVEPVAADEEEELLALMSDEELDVMRAAQEAKERAVKRRSAEAALRALPHTGTIETTGEPVKNEVDSAPAPMVKWDPESHVPDA